MSFSAYPIYKNSGDEWLSEVPEHWEVLPLKHFAEVDNSGCYGVEPADGDHIRPVATTAQIGSEGRFDVGRMSDRGFSAQELARYECSPGDVLVVKSSGSAENIISGKAGLVREDTPVFVFSNFLMRLRYRKDVCLPSFLYSLLISHLTRERIKQMCSTTTYPNLQVGLYTSAKLPCPPLSEQTQIARFLDHETARIDALIEEQQRLIELLKEKRQAVISHAVTKGLDPTAPMKDSGVEWLGEVPAHWVLEPLKYQCRFSGGGTPSKDNLEYWNGDIPWVSPKDMKTFWITDTEDKVTATAVIESSTNMVEPGALLLVVRSGILQRTIPIGINTVAVSLNQDMKALRFCVEGMAEFVAFLIKGFEPSILLEWRKQGATVESIEHEYLANTILAVPPLIELEAIVKELREIETKYEVLEDQSKYLISTLQERRSALISAAVTGKIDVHGWQPPVSTQAAKLEVAEAN